MYTRNRQLCPLSLVCIEYRGYMSIHALMSVPPSVCLYVRVGSLYGDDMGVGYSPLNIVTYCHSAGVICTNCI